MDDFVYLIKTAGPKMVPFIKAVTIYFMLVSMESKGELRTAIFKCAPIVCLMLFIMLYGFSLSKEHTYSQRILIGLIFSCVGDALLNYDLFPHGMVAFGIAQAFYIAAFGFRPLKLWIGILIYIFGATIVSLIYHKLSSILIYGLPIYALLLTTMCWRALAQTNNSTDYRTNLIKKICAVGSILFVISDGCIAIDRFYVKIPNAGLYIMITYYAAQFAITLSIIAQKKPVQESTKTQYKKIE